MSRQQGAMAIRVLLEMNTATSGGGLACALSTIGFTENTISSHTLSSLLPLRAQPCLHCQAGAMSWRCTMSSRTFSDDLCTFTSLLTYS